MVMVVVVVVVLVQAQLSYFGTASRRHQEGTEMHPYTT
jgi:hypothetical protein